MKRLFSILFVIALISTSCASLYTAMYAPSEIKSVDGELVFTASSKGYEVINIETKEFEKQKTNNLFGSHFKH
jgi:ABC-type glycerol-3-phosphate transport system substrate-binding protein